MNWLNKQGAGLQNTTKQLNKRGHLPGLHAAQQKRVQRNQNTRNKTNQAQAQQQTQGVGAMSCLPPLQEDQADGYTNSQSHSQLPSLGPTDRAAGLSHSQSEPSVRHPRRQHRRPTQDNTSNDTQGPGPGPGFSAMFFDDSTDLDAPLYTNMLKNTDQDAFEQVSTQEFIKQSKRALKSKQASSQSQSRNAQENIRAHNSHDQQVETKTTSLLAYANQRTAASLKKIENLRAATPDLYTLPSEGKGRPGDA